MRRSTLVFLLLLLAMAGLYYYLNNREQPADIALTLTPEAEVTYLFTAEEGLPTTIRIEARTGEVVEVTRSADGAWELVLPENAAVEQAAVEAAASQVTTMPVLDSVPDVDADVVGLANPEYVLTVVFTSDVERMADIGVITPTESGYYVRDPAGRIVIASRSSVDSLLGLLTSPPYLETPTADPGSPAALTPTP